MPPSAGRREPVRPDRRARPLSVAVHGFPLPVGFATMEAKPGTRQKAVLA
jgi:hypothetical protein